MAIEGKKFVLDYLGKYYFYEVSDFKASHEDADMILQKIEEYSRYQQGDHAFTKSKFGNITESYTEKQVEVVIAEASDDVWIQGEKRHLDLNYKMEVTNLEDHVRIATRLIEDGESISCLMYINYEQDKAFLEALEQLKARSPH